MKYVTAVAHSLTVGVLMAVACAAAAQQTFPTKPIRVILPFAPGGLTDALVRLVGQKLTESWGQPVMMDNRPGGDAMIGTEALAKSPPDGHTIMQTSSVHVSIPLLHQNVPFDVIKDFVPVGTL